MIAGYLVLVMLWLLSQQRAHAELPASAQAANAATVYIFQQVWILPPILIGILGAYVSHNLAEPAMRWPVPTTLTATTTGRPRFYLMGGLGDSAMSCQN